MAKKTLALFPGTLEVLILAMLQEAIHGYLIARRIYCESGNVFHIEEGSLYPALQRLLIEERVSGDWGRSSRNRRSAHLRSDSRTRSWEGRSRDRSAS